MAFSVMPITALADEVVYKWIVSHGDVDSKLATTSNTVSLVITEDITVTAFTDVKQEVKD